MRADLGDLNRSEHCLSELFPASVALTKSSSSLSWERSFLENLWQISDTFMPIVPAVLSGTIKCAEKH